MLFAAFSGEFGFFASLLAAEDDALTVCRVAEHVREELNAHDTFVKLILCGATVPSPVEHGPSLHHIMGKDPQTSLAVKKLIAEFGIPTGKELDKLHRVRNNLSLAGFG